MNSFYQCERKQHEENFQRLESSSFWCFERAFSCRPPPDGSLGEDWTRLRTQLEIEPMFADVKREGCGIAWKPKLLCWANEDCCELAPSTETKSGTFGLKPSREACCWKMPDIFRWCVMDADLYELKDFYARSTALRNFLEFHHQATVRCLFSEPSG